MESKASTFAEKALACAAGLEYVSAGDLVEARPDRILTDNTAAIAGIFYGSSAGSGSPTRSSYASPWITPRPRPRQSTLRTMPRRAGL